MIDPKELRLGNAVLDSCGLVTILDEDILEVVFAARHYSAYEGILLTPDILEKCGFENKSNSTDYYFRKGDIIIGGWQRTLYPSLPAECGLESYGDELKYLHQLQNLYYSLTGEELEITL